MLHSVCSISTNHFQSNNSLPWNGAKNLNKQQQQIIIKEIEEKKKSVNWNQIELKKKEITDIIVHDHNVVCMVYVQNK